MNDKPTLASKSTIPGKAGTSKRESDSGSTPATHGHYPGRITEPELAATKGTANAIRAAALELFAVRGYAATTMADIADAVGIRAPSIYNHVESKQELLTQIMVQAMNDLIEGLEIAVRNGGDNIQKVRRIIEAHVRYHAQHHYEAFVGSRELRSLDDEGRRIVLSRRALYEHGLREVIEEGLDSGEFDVRSSRLASYSLLDMGMGVASWYREDGDMTIDQIVYQYGDFALRLLS